MSLSQVINYNNPANFTYDNTKIEVLTSAKLKDQRPSDAIFFHDFNQNNANWNKGGANTTTLIGGATISAGKLNIPANLTLPTGATLPAGTVKLDQVGTIRFPITPSFGSPTVSMYLFSLYNDVNNNSRLDVYQSLGDRRIRVQGYDSTGVLRCSGDFFGAPAAWTPGNTYELEFDFNFTSGTHRMFIDGTLLGTITYAYTRDDTLCKLYIGPRTVASSVDTMGIDYFSVFNTVQHTANYTAPSAAMFPAIYPIATAYPIIVNSGVLTDALEGFAESSTKPAGTSIQYAQNIDGSDFYRDITPAWVPSTGFSETNTLADMDAYTSEIDLTLGGTAAPKAYLYSVDGFSTPILVSNTVDYSFRGALVPCTQVEVYGYVSDNCGPVEGAVLTFKTADVQQLFDKFLSVNKTVTTMSNGYFDVELPVGAVIDIKGSYVDSLGKSRKFSGTFTVPGVDSNLEDLI
jgi:hypothetical protein